MESDQSRRIYLSHAKCKKNLLKLRDLLLLLNKLSREERNLLFPFLNEEALHLFFELINNTLIEHRQTFDDETVKSFKDELIKFDFADNTQAFKKYDFFGNRANTLEKKREKLLKELNRQEGDGFGLFAALLPLIANLISRYSS